MKVNRILLLIFSILGLIGVRIIENHIFYDPFLEYFKTINKSKEFPDFEMGLLILNHILRFTLNLIFSILIIYVLFKRKELMWQACILTIIFFTISFLVYIYCIYTQFEIGYVFSFYMRRFVIQPLVLLLLIPLFYYKIKTENQ